MLRHAEDWGVDPGESEVTEQQRNQSQVDLWVALDVGHVVEEEAAQAGWFSIASEYTAA